MRRMKRERLRRGWNQTVVAYRAKLATSDVSKIESGRTFPYPSQLKRLVKVFGIDGTTLMEEVHDAGAETV